MNITPLTVSSPTSAHTINATQFTNGTTTIVELVPKPLQAVTDSLMAMRGLQRTTHRPVGWALPQPVGFIHWVAINHPQDMPNMLKYLRELSWAEHNVVANPVKVKIRLQKSIDDIIVAAPHCAPAFIMELAHYFAAEKKSSFVKPYLDLIRTLEKTHNLPIDYDQRMTYFVEFAGCKKVVTDAIIRSEAYNVEEYFTPQQGFDYIVQLVAHIYLGNGHQYYSGAPKFHVHYYGRSIGISEDEADTIVIKEFLKARKFTPNVSRYFHLRQDILRKLVLENRKYQEQLIASCPWGSGFQDACYKLLRDTEAWQELTHNPRRLAQWLFTHITAGRYPHSQWILDTIGQAHGAFDGMVFPTTNIYYASLELIDALAAAGVTWEDPAGPTKYYSSAWKTWCTGRDKFRRDLPAIAADSHLRQTAVQALDVMQIINHSDLFLRYKAAGELAAAALDRFADHRAITQNLGAVDWCYEKKILGLTDPKYRQLNSEAIDRIMDFDPVTELINTISYQTNQTHYHTDHIPSRQEAAELLALDNLDHLDPTVALIVANIHETHNWFTKLNQEIRGTTPTIGTLTDPATRYLYELEQTRGNPTAKSIINQITDLVDRLAQPQQFAQSPKAGTFVNPWVRGIGHEQTLIALLARPHTNPELAAEIRDFLIAATHAGVYGSGWCYRTEIREFDGLPLHVGWHHGAWVLESRTASYRRTTHMLVHPDHTNLDAFHFVDKLPHSLTGEQFLHQLEQLDTIYQAATPMLPGGITLAEGVHQLAGRTALTHDAAHAVLSGVMNDNATPQLYAPGMVRDILEAGTTNNLMQTGLDFAAIGDYWDRYHGAPQLHLTDEEYAQLIPLELKEPYVRVANTLTDKFYDVPSVMDQYLVILIAMAHLFPRTDLRRAAVAGQLLRLKDLAIHQAAEGHWRTLFTGKLGELRPGDSPKWLDQQTIRALTEGHMDELIADLQQEPDQEAAAAGNPYDPCVSAPNLVTQVVGTLGIPHDSARYFLQIAALPNPTDKNVRAWNGWKPKQLTNAATPLVEQGLVVQEKRRGAGRTRFLPGDWLPKTKLMPLMEEAKTPLYLIWNTPKPQPVVRGCPPLVPLPVLFHQAWDLHQQK